LQNNLHTVDFSLLLVAVMAIADEVDSQLAQAMTSYIAEASPNHLEAQDWDAARIAVASYGAEIKRGKTCQKVVSLWCAAKLNAAKAHWIWNSWYTARSNTASLAYLWIPKEPNKGW
jgi:hypothetical protein